MNPKTCGYYFIPSDEYDPGGPDGKGRNRLRIEIMEPSPRCGLVPLDEQAAWTMEHRSRFWKLSWSRFAPCEVGRCPLQRERYKRTAPMVIREHNEQQGVLFLVEDATESSFECYSIWFKNWESLYRSQEIRIAWPKRDKYGRYWSLL